MLIRSEPVTTEVSSLKRHTSFVLVLVGGLVLAGALSGCGGSKTDDSKALEAHQWQATTVASMHVSGGSPITAAFEGGTITGNTGGNQYQGTYQTQPGNGISIQIGPMTRAAGSPTAMKFEAAYVAALGQAATYKVDGSKLTLLSSTGAELVVYSVFTPAALTGTNWVCTMYNNGRGGFQSVAASSTITALFEANGTLSGSGGVNQYHTTYTVTSDSISIAPPAATMIAGPPDVMNQEAAYFAALGRASTYAIEGSTMTLRAPDGAAMVAYTDK